MGTSEATNLGNGEGSSGKVREAFQVSLLRHPLRRQILKILRERPGLNKNQLAKRLDIYPNQVDFHLRRMEKGDLVEMRPSARDSEILCFRVGDAGLWEDERTRILFGRRPLRQVGLYLADHPGTSSQKIAGALDVSTVTVRHHIRTLLDHDLATRWRIGRRFEYHPTEPLEAWVDEVGSGFERAWEA